MLLTLTRLLLFSLMMMYVSGTVEKLPSRRVEEEEEEEDDRSSGPLLFPVSLLAAVPL